MIDNYVAEEWQPYQSEYLVSKSGRVKRIVEPIYVRENPDLKTYNINGKSCVHINKAYIEVDEILSITFKGN